MDESLTWLPVVALALIDESQRVLLQRQSPGKRHGGSWEFPGGKVEAGELPRQALVREIAEELGITVSSAHLRPALVAEEEGDPHILMWLYVAHVWSGEPDGQDGQEWGWFSPNAAQKLPLAPMDRDMLQRLFR